MDDLVTMMQGIVGADASICRQYLDATGGDIEEAIGLFFASGGDALKPPTTTRAPAPASARPHSVEDDESMARRLAAEEYGGGGGSSDIGTVTPQMASTLVPSMERPGGGAMDPYRAMQLRQEMHDQMMAYLTRDGGEAPPSRGPGRGADGWEGIPDFVSRDAPAPPAESPLEKQFAAPRYAASGTLRDVCMRAVTQKKWVLISLYSDDFDSKCLNRDIWNTEMMANLVDCFFTLYMRSSSSTEGQEVAASYKLTAKGIKVPCLLIVNPVTKMLIKEIPVTQLKQSSGTGYSVENAVDRLYQFVDKEGQPERPVQLDADAEPAKEKPANRMVEHVVDDDGDSGGESTAKRQRSPPRAPTPPPPPPPPSRKLPEVELASLTVPGTTPGAFKLRIKFPTGAVEDVVVAPDTKLKAFVDAVKTRVSQEASSAIGSDGNIAIDLLAGFPPKKVYQNNGAVSDDATLASVPGLRSGDVVTVHLC